MAIVTYQDRDGDFDVPLGAGRGVGKNAIYYPIAVHIGALPTFGYTGIDFTLRYSMGKLLTDFVAHPLERPVKDLLGKTYTGVALMGLYLAHIIERCQEEVLKQRDATFRQVDIIVPSGFDTRKGPDVEYVLRHSSDLKAMVRINIRKPLFMDEDPPLDFAIRHGDTKMVWCMLKNGYPVDTVNRDGDTPLVVAMRSQRYEAVCCLLEMGVEAELPEDQETAMLQDAVRAGFVGFLDVFSKRKRRDDSWQQAILDGASASGSGKRPSKPKKPLDPIAVQKRVVHAMAAGKPQVAEDHLLLYGKKEGGAALAKLADGLVWEAIATCDPAFMDLLVRHGANVRQTDSGGMDFMMKAAGAGLAKEVQFLLAYGFPLDATDAQNQTALCKAVFQGHIKIANLLLEHGAAIGDKDSLLEKANQEGNKAAADFLKRLGAVDAISRFNRSLREHKIQSRSNRKKQGGTNPLLDRPDASGRTPLHYKALQGGKYDVCGLLEEGASVDVVDRDGRTPLLLAAQAGKWGVVGTLLRYGASIDVTDKDGNTALLLAAKAGEWKEVDTLLLEGAGIHAADKGGDTLLLLAAKAGKWELVAGLEREGASIDVADANGNTPLLCAVRARKWETAVSLVKHGASADAADKDGDTPMLLAIQAGSLKMAEFLLEHGASAGTALKDGGSLLTVAAKAGRWGIAETLVKHGASVEVVDKDGNTALHHAAAAGNVNTIKLLMKHGASTKAVDAQGRTPVMLAVLSGTPEAVKYMVGHGVRINDADATGRTPLMYALTARDEKMVCRLLWWGASVEVTDPSGRTPLVYAINTKSWNIVKLILQYGASPSAKDAQGKTASAYADGKIADAIRTYMEALAGVMEAAATGDLAKIKEDMRKVGSVDACDASGRTPLMVAAKANQTGIVKYLLGRRAGVSVVDKTGATALQMAVAAGSAEAAKLIENHYSW